MFPVGSWASDGREAFGTVNYDVLCAVKLDTKKGKMFLEMACQVLLRRTLERTGQGVGRRSGREPADWTAGDPARPGAATKVSEHEATENAEQMDIGPC